MSSLTVYQTDADGAYLFPVQANEIALQPGQFNIPYGAVEAEPPTVPSGQVAQWVDGAWSTVEDNRSATLYVASSGEQYTLGESIEVDSASVSYNGLGAIPNWLTTTAPAAPTEQATS